MEVTAVPNWAPLSGGSRPSASSGAARGPAVEAGLEVAKEPPGLDARLREELRPKAAKAAQLAEELRARVAKLRDTLGGLAEGRRQAAELFGQLSRSQVSEIKQLARTPPDCIRRTLIAAWLLLHCDRFKGRSVVQFDETKDWPKLQRMLGEESFVTGILAFDTERLAMVPQVVAYVASTYLGLRCADEKSFEGDATLEALGALTAGGGGQQKSGLEGQRPSKPLFSRSVSQAALQPAKGLRASSSSSRLRRSESRLKPPLEVEMVARASGPCGILVQWMKSLVVESMEYRRLQAQLAPAEAELQAAERRQRAAEGEVAEAEGTLATARLQVAERGRARAVAERPREEPGRPFVEQPPSAACEGSRRGSAALGQLPPVLSPAATPRTPPAPAAAAPLARTPRRAAQVPSNLPPVQNIQSPLDFGAAPPRHVERAPFASLKAAKQEAAKLSQPTCKIELDVTGSLTSVRQRLARLGVPFGRNKSEIIESDSAQSQALAKIKDLLGEHRGRLKLRLQGHCEPGEGHGIDTDRGLAVARWLQESAGTPAGWLRVEGIASSADLGRCVMPLAIQELVPLYGPISAEVASCSAPVGLYFEAQEARLTPEACAILGEMARWLAAEGASACVEGHCDKAEPPDVALERARAVHNALVKLGVSPRRLRPESRAAACPLSRHAAPNRRAELHLD